MKLFHKIVKKKTIPIAAIQVYYAHPLISSPHHHTPKPTVFSLLVFHTCTHTMKRCVFTSIDPRPSNPFRIVSCFSVVALESAPVSAEPFTKIIYNFRYCFMLLPCTCTCSLAPIHWALRFVTKCWCFFFHWFCVLHSTHPGMDLRTWVKLLYVPLYLLLIW